MPVSAEVTTDRGASILVFPKVVGESSADTVVQIANLSDNNINVFCAYVSGSDGTWQSLDFSLSLAPRRPVWWSTARGRVAGPGEMPLDVPAAPAGFRGELLCLQVDGTGAPFSGNELAGLATLSDLASGDVTAYSAAGLRSAGFNDGDGFLCIGDAQSDTCFISEYDPCPAEWILNFPTDGASDSQKPGATFSSMLTVVPCSQDLLAGTPSTVDIDITVFNELGEQFTGMTSVTCWGDLSLNDIAEQIFTREILGTDFASARLRPAEGSGGFMLVAQTSRTAGDAPSVTGSASINVFSQGGVDPSDVIVLPASMQ